MNEDIEPLIITPERDQLVQLLRLLESEAQYMVDTLPTVPKREQADWLTTKWREAAHKYAHREDRHYLSFTLGMMVGQRMQARRMGEPPSWLKDEDE